MSIDVDLWRPLREERTFECWACDGTGERDRVPDTVLAQYHVTEWCPVCDGGGFLRPGDAP